MTAWPPLLACVLLPSLVLGCRGDHEDSAAARDREPGWFREVSPENGLAFTYDPGPSGRRLMPEIMGGGCALFDMDGDGRLDAYLVNGNRRFQGAPAGVAEPVNRMFRQDETGRFVDVTERSGLGDGGYGMGVAVADFDNDGLDDVYVTNDGPDRLYRNLGDGRFADVTEQAGIDVPGWSASAAFLDYDVDGFLDLFVTQYVDYDGSLECRGDAGRPEYCGPKESPPLHDVLLHNNGAGTFSDVSVASGIAMARAAGLGVACDDFNGDGRVDIYVTNDAYANHLWINRGDGTFSEQAVLFGAAYNFNGQAEAGMGIVSADFDHDGNVDLFMTHLVSESNTFYRNLGEGRGFTDESGQSGLAATSMVFTGFGTVALDADLDGDLDLAIVNGRVRRGARESSCRLEAPWDEYAECNLFYVNDGEAHFGLDTERSSAWGALAEISRGLAAGDVDGDGDVDLLLSNIMSPARLYLNDAPRRGNWLRVRAIDPRYRRDAIGAVITLPGPSGMQRRVISGAVGYLSHGDPAAHFGIPRGAQPTDIHVRWPDGLTESFAVEGLNRTLELRRGGGRSIS